MNGPKPSCGAITLAMVMLVCLVAATAGSVGAQTTWHVPDDPEAATIAEALASALAGDTIVIAPGTYFEHDLVMTEGVLLRSELNDAQNVIVDAAGLGRVMTGTDLTGATVEEQASMDVKLATATSTAEDVGYYSLRTMVPVSHLSS